MEKFTDIVSLVNGWVWGPWFLVLLVGTHVFLTFRTGFIQKKIFKAIKLSFTKDEGSEGDVSQFGALTTALASTIGTGNIVGVGTAIAAGGPGAVLWMWLTGVFGIATKYSECLISVKYRVKDETGGMLGGAMYALQRGLNIRWLGVVFAVLTAICAFGIGSGVQANATATILKDNLNVPYWATGILLVVLVGAVLIGGIKWIAKVCEKLVPFMAIFYILGCLVLLVMNAKYIGAAFATIATDAFSAKAVAGGFLGQGVMAAMRFGVARGLFSNESGMGSAPIVAAAAKTKNPVRQALVSMTGTFWDTVVICLMTGLVLTTTILKNGLTPEDLGGMHITTVAFNDLGVIGSVILVVGILTFASSTILGWSYYGDRCIDYLFGVKAVIPYRVLYIIIAFLGATIALDIVWNIADTLNALMAIPNIVAVLMLSKVIANETKFSLKPGNLDLADEAPIPLRSDIERERKEARAKKDK
ncbi:MAG: sodium:alanine symporter family protein [Clostridiales Family XIII bacterium]|jgi:AGCS family alanine or glycine:cation symporter|nr:sodium:alanine symporter family protein [Clostridiales Family XIII bacterium]